MTPHTGLMISQTLQFNAAINTRAAFLACLINYTLMKSDRDAPGLDSSTLLPLPFTFQDDKHKLIWCSKTPPTHTHFVFSARVAMEGRLTQMFWGFFVFLTGWDKVCLIFCLIFGPSLCQLWEERVITWGSNHRDPLEKQIWTADLK